MNMLLAARAIEIIQHYVDGNDFVAVRAADIHHLGFGLSDFGVCGKCSKEHAHGECDCDDNHYESCCEYCFHDQNSSDLCVSRLAWVSRHLFLLMYLY